MIRCKISNRIMLQFHDMIAIANGMENNLRLFHAFEYHLDLARMQRDARENDYVLFCNHQMLLG